LIFLKPLVSASVMGVVVLLLHRMSVGVLGNAVATLLAIAVGAAVYGYMILATHAVTMEEIGMIPRGDRLIRWMGKKRRDDRDVR
ncbi:MAG: hypothetical protein WCY59_08460, partial [Anaerovoracaceae bacterium]